MANTIRQNILAALKARLQTILIAGAYNTNLGQQIHYDLATSLNDSQTPACKYQAREDNIQQRFGSEVRTMPIHAEISAVGNTADDDVEKAIGDFIACLAADDTLSGNCKDVTNFIVGDPIIDHQSVFSVQVPIRFEIIYATLINNPYTAV